MLLPLPTLTLGVRTVPENGIDAHHELIVEPLDTTLEELMAPIGAEIAPHLPSGTSFYLTLDMKGNVTDSADIPPSAVNVEFLSAALHLATLAGMSLPHLEAAWRYVQSQNIDEVAEQYLKTPSGIKAVGLELRLRRKREKTDPARLRPPDLRLDGGLMVLTFDPCPGNRFADWAYSRLQDEFISQIAAPLVGRPEYPLTSGEA